MLGGQANADGWVSVCTTDLITSATDGSVQYPEADELAKQCGKLQLLDRLLVQLHKGGHKVLIFSQVLLHSLAGL